MNKTVNTQGNQCLVSGRTEIAQGEVILKMEDTTEDEQIERQLAEALDFNRRIISDVPVGIVVFETSGLCVMANKAAARIIQGTVAEMLKQNFRQLESWRDSGLLAAAERTLATQRPQNGEFHFVSTFGKTVWVVGHLSCFVRNNQPHLLVTLNDITERRRVEEALLQEKHLFRSLTDNIPDRIYFKDAESRFLRNNRAHLRAFGLTDPEGAWGKTDFDFFTEEHARQAMEDEQRVMRTGIPITVEEKETWPDGRVGWSLTTKLPLHNERGDIVGTFGISRDITERKVAEEKIREQAALLDEAHDAIWVIDHEDHISYWNQGAEQLYGWSVAEAVGKHPLQLLYQGVASQQLLECIKALNERGEWRGELQETTKDGRTITVQGRANLIRDERIRRKSILIINTDITEKKKIETQFLRSQRMESLGTLAGGIAHDLNNVLTPLLFSVQLLRSKVRDAEGLELLGALEANVLRGAKLIKQVLAFGRGIKGERAAVQLELVVREIEQIIGETFPKSLEFQKRLPAGLWTVTGDATQLYQVLLNLCVNSRDAMPNGGKLSIHMENRVLDEIQADLNLGVKPGSYLVVTVTDTGMGIPKEVQDRMFEPFFTTKEPGKGTGLGLSTCLGIVKSHGGHIKCYSEPGKGSVFKVYLPANCTPAAMDLPTGTQHKLPRGQGEVVLVVDDEKAVRAIAQKTLEHFGYRVVTAANGAEAVALYQQQRDEIEVVIMDMAMPVMDGHTAIAALEDINPQVKVIGASGWDPEGGTSKAAEAVLRHFLPKPYTTSALLQMLQQVLVAMPAA